MKAARVVEYPPEFTRNHRISGVITRRFTMKARGTLLLAGLSLMLGACSATAVYPEEGVKPEFSFPVTTNETPYRSEEHTSELQSLMRTSYAVFCLKKKQTN